MNSSRDSLRTRRLLHAAGRDYHYFSLEAAQTRLRADLSLLPYALKVLLENLLRHEDGDTVTPADIQAVADWLRHGRSEREINYRPARVLMQDFTGVPAVADLAAMRDALAQLGGDPERVNPLSPVDLVIDHSVTVDRYGQPTAYQENVRAEMVRNRERYQFLRWGQQAFDNFRVVPPGTGICHQVNLEYLAQCVWHDERNGDLLAYPDTLVGTDSHTTMINALGILGWGVGGIEAEAAMLGQPISMLLPEVVGCRLSGRLREGVTATDLVLTLTERLRQQGVVGKFVEFYGDGLDRLPLPDRATIANMAPEYGATCGFFPVDQETLRYLRLTGRDRNTVSLVETYCKAQGLWRNTLAPEPRFSATLELDLATVEPSLAGPKRPQDRVRLQDLRRAFDLTLVEAERCADDAVAGEPVEGAAYRLRAGDVVIAAITSCTNTSNPSVLMGAGLLARNAVEHGLTPKPWVKASLAPGSKVVTDYLKASGLLDYLEQLGFYLVGYGCTTCIGNSGPLAEPIERAIMAHDLTVCSVLSGNRNFEGRIHPLVKANWLASPPLVVAYALAGTMRIDLSQEPLGQDRNGKPVYLRDIWPSNHEIAEAVTHLSVEMFHKEYAAVFEGDKQWQALQVAPGHTYPWQADSTYIRQPPFFLGMQPEAPSLEPVPGARILALLGDSVTTDHISPAGSIKVDSPAGRYLLAQGVEPTEFNSYGARRGNHEVMVRGTFANIRIRNAMTPELEGGYTRHQPSGEQLAIYDAAVRYQQEGTPLVVVAGKEYGTGSSRDWAAKGTRLLGVRAVLAESFERIHRSNLLGMGVLPLQFAAGEGQASWQLEGTEQLDLLDLNEQLKPRQSFRVRLTRADGQQQILTLLCRIDTGNELEYYRHGGILPYVLRRLAAT